LHVNVIDRRRRMRTLGHHIVSVSDDLESKIYVWFAPAYNTCDAGSTENASES
jgi:hypothetical protein